MTTPRHPRMLLVFGTRPEAIKMAPLVRSGQNRQEEIETIVCLTGQHRELLQQVVDYFEISPDYNLDLMTSDQSLAEISSRCLAGVDRIIGESQPDYVVVQGDTTTAAMAAAAAFYRRLPLVHVEAGLRTGDLLSPWPEEFNRRVASLAGTIHCCPTQAAADNLRGEGTRPAAIHVTGNTVVDALQFTIAREQDNPSNAAQWAGMLGERHVLITCHRRESFGGPLEEICTAIGQLAAEFPDVQFIYPLHPNPQVRQPVERRLGGQPNVQLIAPLPYPQFVWLMAQATLILTDSGGVQEEAPTFRKPVVVMRSHTERRELIEAGGAVLAGASSQAIVQHVSQLLTDDDRYRAMQVDQNPYGDGQAAERILDLILSDWRQRT